MDFQLKSIREQCLQHLVVLVPRCGPIRLANDVPTVRGDPTRTSDELIGLNAIRHSDRDCERYVHPSRLHRIAEIIYACVRFAGFDGGDLKGGRRFLRERSQSHPRDRPADSYVKHRLEDAGDMRFV